MKLNNLWHRTSLLKSIVTNSGLPPTAKCSQKVFEQRHRSTHSMPMLEKRHLLFWRAAVFALASLSLACLLGHFYQLWTMHWFACWVLVPATILMAAIVFHPGAARTGISRLIVEGALGGVIAAVAYDLYRLPFVLNGAPLFRVFAKFGELLLQRNDPAWAVQTAGWTYHFSNGAALGIMFLALVWKAPPRFLLWGAVLWALTIEMILLLSPYSAFVGLPLDGRFLFLTGSAHLAFGITLGAWTLFRRAKWAEPTPTATLAA
jgi:hypothetical protein